MLGAGPALLGMNEVCDFRIGFDKHLRYVNFHVANKIKRFIHLNCEIVLY